MRLRRASFGRERHAQCRQARRDDHGPIGRCRRSIGERRLWRQSRGCRSRRGPRGPAQGIDGALERQPLRCEDACRDRPPFTDDRGKQHRAVHARTRAVSDGGRGILDDARQVGMQARTALARRQTLAETSEVAGNVIPQSVDACARLQDEAARLLLLGQGEKRVLDGDVAVPLRIGIVHRPRQRHGERACRRTLANVLGHRHALFIPPDRFRPRAGPPRLPTAVAALGPGGQGQSLT